MKTRNKIGLIILGLGILFGWAGGAFADQSLKTVSIITPEWKDQTNRDGTGLFFDIVRAVYQPAHIKMVFRFAPWKRCQATVNVNKADAMLCVWKSHALSQNQLTPRFPLYVEDTAVVFKKGSLFSWQGIHTLDYHRVAWLRGYNYHTVKAMSGIQLDLWEEVDSHEDAWQLLNHDRVDFYMDAGIDIDLYIRDENMDMGLYEKQRLWSQKAYVAFANTPRSARLAALFS
ncbi:MAG: transporter substrate-binding domain-containing protein [Desulfobacter sp.]|nr:transporter substrate-binding domain-containing protein [Desulfobacter sp.]